MFFILVDFNILLPRPCASPANARSAFRGAVAAIGGEASDVGAAGCGEWAV